MKHALLASACLLLAAAPAFGQSTASTADFVKTVAISDMFEIESSKLALEKKVAADQDFAQRMVRDHIQTSEQLKHLSDTGEVKAPLPSGLDEQHKQMLEKLRGENGADFSKDYNQMQLAGHKEAVSSRTMRKAVTTPR
jgi:putative membrane protein